MIRSPEAAVAALPLPQFNEGYGSAFPAAHIAVSTLDNCGKLADRSALRHLGWDSGQHVSLTIAEGIVGVAEKRDSKHVIERHGYLRLPAEIRTCARINHRDRLLLIAIRDLRVLLVFPPGQVVAALRPFIPLVRHGR